MSRLKSKGHILDFQVLDNEVSTKYSCTIIDDRNCTLQLVPPDVHCCNIDKHVICTFKSHFSPILAGVSNFFPNCLWDQLLPQTELTLNLLRQSTLALNISVWEK